MRIVNIGNKEHYESVIQSSHKNLVVILFYTVWCDTSKKVVKLFEQLCQKYDNVIFATVDTDDHEVKLN